MAQEELVAILAPYTVRIEYAPLPSEVAFAAFLPEHPVKNRYVVPVDPNMEPTDEALRTIAFAAGRPACVLVPGTSFDAHGTRHGPGGGWYDRFLAAIPSSWLRIGFCFDDQFSDTPLVREPWDQPVDLVCVVTKATGTLSCVRTGARSEYLLP